MENHTKQNEMKELKFEELKILKAVHLCIRTVNYLEVFIPQETLEVIVFYYGCVINEEAANNK